MGLNVESASPLIEWKEQARGPSPPRPARRDEVFELLPASLPRFQLYMEFPRLFLMGRSTSKCLQAKRRRNLQPAAHQVFLDPDWLDLLDKEPGRAYACRLV